MPRCFHLISPFAAASEAAGLESEQTKQGERLGSSQIERKLHLIKMCAHTHKPIGMRVLGYKNSTPPGNLFSSYSHAIETH